MSRTSLSTAVAFVAALLMISACTKREPQGAEQLSFGTPEEAVAALVAALEKNDTEKLQRLLGPDTDDLVSSGDAVADRAERESFLARYREQHRFVAGSPNDLVLQVGEDEWPMPIPLVRQKERWQFDGPAGADEIVMRRVGSNELRTIDVMRGYVEAQEDYAAAEHDGVAAGVYARRLHSEPGKHDGLYWEAAVGESPSPAGPMLAAAAAEGYSGAQAARKPYHGYLFRLLLSQGPSANGGARDYLVDGKLTRGFALLAYPESYGASGVMTFMVNQDGVAWQRDLGEDTTQQATAIQQFDPDESWTPIALEADAAEPVAQLANPASVNCSEQGGTLVIERTPKGDEYGVCRFEDNRQCEEWALLRKECPSGGIRVTGYVTDAGRFCAITGGTYKVTSENGAEEQGTCMLPGGKTCDAAAYYSGTCARS